MAASSSAADDDSTVCGDLLHAHEYLLQPNRGQSLVERANGFLETSFMPGREFDSPGDYNTS